MMKRSFLRATFAILPWLIFAHPGKAAINGNYVSEAWVDVMPSRESNAKPVTHWTANTQVEVLKREGKWCQVLAQDGVKGYIPCTALSDKPLRLKDLAVNPKTGEEVRDAAAKAFWIAPSFSSFESYGTSLNYSMLNERQTQEQQITHKAIRFPVPQFEAMKKKLASGILPRFEDHLQRQGLQETSNTANEAFLTVDMFPLIKPSLFTQPADMLMLSEANADLLTAMLGKPSIGIAQGKPEYEFGRNDEGVGGIWDIGSLKIKYAEPVILYLISRNGLVGAKSISNESHIGNSFMDGCEEGYAEPPEGPWLNGYPKVKDRIVAFYTTKPLTAKSVQINSRKLRAYVRQSDIDNTKVLKNMVLHTIDLNRDGIADIAILEYRELGPVSEEPLSNFSFFTNINGRWYRAGWESYGECT